MMEPIRIMMADDSPEIRSYFANIITHEEDMDLIGAASSGAEAVQMARELMPDIILMDIQMETRTAGIDASKLILKEHPGIIKTDSISQILTSIRNAYMNQMILRPRYAEKIIQELKRVREEQNGLLYGLNILTMLSNSEFEVLKCLYQGMNARQISESRYVSQGTVKTQIHSILKKFNMKSVSDVVRHLKDIRFDRIIETMHPGT